MQDWTETRIFASRREMICGLIATTLPFSRSAAAQEPVTLGSAAAFVGLALLQGAISYVGGRLLASALGDPVISDAQSWLKNAIAELEAFVSAELRRQLDERVMEQMRADLQGINTNLYQYSSLRASNRLRNKYLLETCDTTTASLVPLSLNYDQALFVTTTAMAYRLFTLYALYELDHDRGHIRSARPTMDDFVRRVSAIRDKVGHQMSPDAHFKINCTIVGETTYTCIGVRDGAPITPLYRAPPTINGRDAFEVMRESIKRRIAPLTEPMQKQADEFLKSANTSIQLAIDGYDKMCRRIGETYSLPAGAPPLLKIGVAKIPAVVVMPGAIVGSHTR
ncbi:hypothetical protein BRDID11004_75460 [Bradyrhizobium diazoefficiens]|uniref:Uncharacterized protein n=1 Tax=Bradyrhizobium diazoefficiens TaxID=1355477 RepID=A0A810AI13_9BRAD|nr:hypothetical protein [Bradyrhizobium diazoefficiens]BBZ91326.1 hypothetical protein F07S3_11590 [Bradyrhizobium diazoefficiens]BCA09312.1 hypothetical protein BDHF08_11590 [Bradyrhizobium diazoefficiens]BCE53649.1 hypothetical protein XF5B_11610 [Bradyrhizobium diazoefficiens]BCE62368.1 hypothetical protein XF6B_11670 [Bradyrhizobium diazoefficiens]